MEVKQETGGDNQEWDWEVLVGGNHNHHHQRHHKHSNSILSESDFEPELEGEREVEGDGDGDPSLSVGGAICSDYFSLEFYNHEHNHNMEDVIQGEEKEEELEFGSGSWMDPGQAQFPIKSRRDMGRIRNSSDSESDSPTSAACCIGTSSNGSGSGNLLSILQPHSKCSTTITTSQSPELELGFQSQPPVKAEPLASDTYNRPDLAVPNFSTGTTVGVEMESFSHSSDTHNIPDLAVPKFSTGTAVGVEMESFSHSSDTHSRPDRAVPKFSNATTAGIKMESFSHSSSVQFDASTSPFFEATAMAKKEEHEQQTHHSENESDSKQQEENTHFSSTHHDEATRRVSWWRVPLEVLKYCVFRVRPIWSLSMAAAALLGFVLLRRAWLSRVKRNTQQGLHLNVTVDDKKVSQFMSRAARLNEAFSVVKRVPIIRPSLPAPGLAPWTVMSMR